MLESFSQDTKNEICSSKNKQKCCRASEIYGMMFGAACFSRERILFINENPTVFIRYLKLIREFIKCPSMSDIMLTDINDAEFIASMLKGLNVSVDCPFDKISREVLSCVLCGWSFVRGMFLSCGTVTSPDNAYHLEFLMRNADTASDFSSLLESLGASPRIIERNDKQYGVYFKDSESIADILGHIGASKATFQIINVKMYKDMRNHTNRVNNCEYANLEKTLVASEQHMRAIEKIIEAGKTDELPDELKMTLDLRAAFPQATLSELAEMHNPPITKSGVNHRLKKIVVFSEKF